MNFSFSFTRISANVKTGPIPVTGTSANSCPSICPLNGAGCYAQSGNTNIHWSKLNKREDKAETYNKLLTGIKSLPNGQLWRMNVYGDLPHNNQVIDASFLTAFVNANAGKRGFTYTHHDMANPYNRRVVKVANAEGFTINLSGNSPSHADELMALNIGPVVTIVPEDTPTISKTPAGNTIVICPAVTNPDKIQCINCGLCAKVDRKSIVGFPVHGTQKKKASKVIQIHTI